MSNNDLHQREFLDAPVACRIGQIAARVAQLETELASAQSGKASLAKIMDRIHDALGLQGQSYQPHQLPGKVQKLMERLRLAEGK